MGQRAERRQGAQERAHGASRSRRRSLVDVAAAACCLLVAACSTVTTKHGTHFKDGDVQQIQPGMSQEQVKSTLGTPSTTASVGTGNAYYYISSTTTALPYSKPKEVDRQVVAVYFNGVGSVERVAQYGIKDGKVFDFISRKTASANTNDDGVLQSLFRNLGKRGSLFGDQ